jgi:hypothetical protein
MRLIFLSSALMYFQKGFSQTEKEIQPTADVRLSFLLFPFTPLLTVEVRTFGNLTIQAETNFLNTHGTNLKYFIKNRMSRDYVFIGVALVENKLLRADNKTTFLPYAGYGYAYRFGNKKQWTFDNRIGIGVTTNVDKNSVYPVIKTGIGRVF